MKTLLTVEEIYAKKAERRKALAALPVAERVEIIERLHEFAVEMREWKEKQLAASTPSTFIDNPQQTGV